MGSPTGFAPAAAAALPARIALDAMGGDLGPAEVVAALSLALADPALVSDITLLGAESALAPLLAAAGLAAHPRVRLVPTSEVITMEDKPIKAFRHKKDSSMARAVELVKTGEAGAVVSCGNTGALMAGGTLRLRTLDGIERPALAAIIPRAGGYFILIDAGANPDAEPRHLVHNALLGAHYARVILGVARPRVGLLTIGTEEGKGNALSNATHAELKLAGANEIVHYVGPTEGFQVFTDHCDVAVCDGFTGNLLLKSWESLAKFFKNTLANEMKANPLRMSGALLAKGAFAALKQRMSPDRYGGAPLLGLRGNILKAHGSSNRHAIKSALLAADKVICADLLAHIRDDAAKLNAVLAAATAAPIATAPELPAAPSGAA
jgi:phosphate acyltransferase